MRRIPEPDLMEGEEQVRAYAQADFAEPHNRFVELFQSLVPGPVTGRVLDLGCGPGDISVRFSRAFPQCVVHGLDGSKPMLDAGRKRIEAEGLRERIRLFQSRLPEADLPESRYEVIISNSLLHHLDDPRDLWRIIRQFAAPQGRVFVMDLLRPATREQAVALVEMHSANEPPVLKRDFLHSLLAAYRPEEIRAQLEEAGLEAFTIQVVSDRHQIVHGTNRT